MSLDLINHKLTTSTTGGSGVIWRENPALDVKINSNGAVYLNNDVVKTMAKRNQYSCYVVGNTEIIPSNKGFTGARTKQPELNGVNTIKHTQQKNSSLELTPYH